MRTEERVVKFLTKATKQKIIPRFSTLLGMRMQFLRCQEEGMLGVEGFQTQVQRCHKQIRLRRTLECLLVGRQVLLYIVSLLTSQIAVLSQRCLETYWIFYKCLPLGNSDDNGHRNPPNRKVPVVKSDETPNFRSLNSILQTERLCLNWLTDIKRQLPSWLCYYLIICSTFMSIRAYLCSCDKYLDLSGFKS